MVVILMIFFVNIMWKWSKTLMTVIFLESLSAIILASALMNIANYYYMIIFMFLFFVGEALVVLSAMYASMRLSGTTYSGIILH